MRIAFPRPGPWAACAFAMVAAMQPLLAEAQSLQCGGNLVGVGESRFSLLQKCGEPAFAETVCMPTRPQERYVPGPGGSLILVPVVPPCVPVEEWTYHRGAGNFLGIVRFRNGAVESVRDGERMR
jgi:hypothetical protein